MSGTVGRPGRVRRVIVVGAGISGLMTAQTLAARGTAVLLVSLLPAPQSRSAAARGGIAAVVAPRPDGDSPARHAADTLRAGGFAAPPAAVRAMVEAAPALVEWLDRAGVPFLRTASGSFARFAHGGSSHPRTLLAGPDTGRQLLGVLDDQVRHHERAPALDARGLPLVGEPLVRRLEQWDLVALVRDDNGVVVGVVAQDRRTLRHKAYAGDAICLATGSAAGLFVPAPRAATLSGSGVAIAARAGAALTGLEAVAWHPTAVPLRDAGFTLAEGLRAEGVRLWTPRDPADRRPPAAIPERDRDYGLERAFDATLPRAAVARALRALGVGSELGGNGAVAAYADLARLPPDRVRDRWGRLLAAFETPSDAAGRSPPLRVAPRIHDTLGGLWVDHEPNAAGTLVADSPRHHATSLPGLYAVGACQALYHGAGLLGGNDLLACLHGATVAAAAITSYRAALARSADDLPPSIFERAEAAAEAEQAALLARGELAPDTSHFALQRVLATVMTTAAALPDDPGALDAAAAAVRSLAERAAACRIPDPAATLNPSLEQARHLDHLLTLAPAVLAAFAREATAAAPVARSEGAPSGGTPTEGATGEGALRRRSLALLDGDGVRFVDSLAYDCAGTRVEVTDALDADPAVTVEEAKRHG